MLSGVLEVHTHTHLPRLLCCFIGCPYLLLFALLAIGSRTRQVYHCCKQHRTESIFRRRKWYVLIFSRMSQRISDSASCIAILDFRRGVQQAIGYKEFAPFLSFLERRRESAEVDNICECSRYAKESEQSASMQCDC
jgi:hypothetical protein